MGAFYFSNNNKNVLTILHYNYLLIYLYYIGVNMNELILKISNHLRLHYWRKGGLRAFCRKHSINYNSCCMVYYHDGKLQEQYPGIVKAILEAIDKDNK